MPREAVPIKSSTSPKGLSQRLGQLENDQEICVNLALYRKKQLQKDCQWNPSKPNAQNGHTAPNATVAWWHEGSYLFWGANMGEYLVVHVSLRLHSLIPLYP